MKAVMIVLRVLGVAAGAFALLLGFVGLGSGDAVGLAVFFIVLGGVLIFFSLRRSPAARAEAQIRRQARRSERFAAAEQARADAAQRARRASEERQRQEERLRRQRAAEQAAWHEHVMQQQQAEQAQQQAAPGPQPQKQAQAESAYRSNRDHRDERRAAAREQGVACCPRCGSTSLSVNKKGFGGGKATVGMLAFGLPGAVTGSYGMNKLKITCLNCGYKYRPGKGRV